DDDAAPPRVDADEVRRRLETLPASLDRDEYVGEGGRLGVLVVRSPLRPLDQRAFELEGRVAALVAEGHYSASLRVSYTGNLLTSAEEYRAVVRDLVNVGAAGAALVLAIVFLFFLRVRAVAALGICIAVGLVWCLAYAELSVGHLNTASGF